MGGTAPAVSSTFVPIRVLWLIKGLGPGGAETLLAAAARAHDHEVFHIECAYVLPHKDHLAEQLEQAGVHCHCLSTKRSDPRWPFRLRRLIAEGQFDIVHSHSPLPAAVGRIAALSLRGEKRPKLVTTEHNAWDTFAAPTRWATRLTARLDDAVCAVSEETKRSMRGDARKQCITLQHGIDVAATAAMATERDAVRNELGISDDELVIGTVANYRDQKDYPNLLRAAAELDERGVPARIVAVGQGQLESEIVALRDELRLQERVMLTGHRPDAARVMAAFDVFTLASKYEGLPVALMEALALGLPIVATRVGGIAETLTDDEAVLVPREDPIALSDAWVKVLESLQLRERLAAASTARASNFDIRGAVDEYEACYRRLCPSVTEAPADAAKPPRRTTPGIEIRSATEDDRPAILALLMKSLGWHDDPRYQALFEWKHDQNPFGRSPMWVACDGDRVVALRVFMRWQFRRGNETLRAVRAVDTATDPDYQGKGLFTALTLHGLDALRIDGVDFIFNTPNEQSLPGYLKMGWQVVGQVPAAFRLRTPGSLLRTAKARVAADLWSLPLEVGSPFDEWFDTAHHVVAPLEQGPREIVTDRSDAFLAWRYGTPLLDYRSFTVDGESLVVRGRQRGAARELVFADSIGLAPDESGRSAARCLRAAGFDHALRAGSPDLRHGFVPLPGGGPVLTFRSLNLSSAPPLANWRLTMGDVELF
jgi:glycosyltransferase involved in cell wall biosynthesis/predicted N-acetyltransferase YhbS